MKLLAIQEVILLNFKNYTRGKYQFGERFNLISGLNGVGKTNLLDALYYVSTGKSYFTPFDHRVVNQQDSFFRLDALIQKNDETHSLTIKVKPGTSKEILVDGNLIPRISEYLGFVPVVFSAPRDIELVFGSGSSRRRYTDHLLCQIDPQYLQSLMAYNHLLQNRNAALKQGFDDLKRVVNTYDEQMAPLASLLYQKRKWLAERFRPLLNETYHALSENRESIELIYESKLHDQPYEVLADMHWEADKYGMRTNAGIHKDDYDLRVKDMPAKEYGSQGQIKSLIFALHLSKHQLISAQSGHKAVLMLDDIFDKLDERRLHRLMEILSTDAFGQVFITDTSSKRVSGFLGNGQIHQIEM